MSEIRNWLATIGLGQYGGAFEANKIDMDLLRQVDDQVLKDIGVSAAGDRLRIRNAIAKLAAAPVAEVNLGPTTPKHETTAASAERRHVTVMFSDLVGSTALSARMDPEDLREVISAYQKCVAETVRRFDGFVAKYMGDGVLVYFGYPQAHEDDAERAVRAGMELIGGVTALGARVSLQTRVGIATGLVVVGDLVGAGEAQERGIVGETPNLAARLLGIAQPNMLVIAESTRRLLGNLFELEHLGLQDLKGIAGPVAAWAAIRPSSVESRFEAMRTANLTALVGREEESELLMRRWSRAKSGQGQVVLISGEAGIGKSRLTAALLENIATQPHTRFRYFCSPQHTDSALYPIIGQMERAAGFVHDDKPQERLDKFDTLLGQTTTEEAALFAEMLSLANDGRYPTLELTPQQRRQRTLEALISQLTVLGSHSPVLMILEDTHWADPTSLELFGRIVTRIPTLRVLLIVTFRPEFDPPWIGQPHVMAMTINRLSQRDVDAMIDRIVGNKRLPPSIRQDIVERTDGIPLFVEEMTKAVLEAESEGAAQRTVAAAPSPTLAIPQSLHASLMARLDRLGPAKELAQIGATIGREFSHALLASVARKPKAEFALALDRLMEAGLLFRQGVPPHATYLFKHALVQEAAYGTLLRESRRALHARIAGTVEREFADIADSQPELLAHHCTEAGLIETAAALWGKAGMRSLARSALVEATAQLKRALAQMATLSGSPVLRREQIRFQVALANALMHTKGYAAPETKDTLDRARMYIEQADALGEPPEDPLLPLSIHYGSWVTSLVAFDGEAVREGALQFLALAEDQGATVAVMVGHRITGTALICTGDVAEGVVHLDRAITLYDPLEHRCLATRFGQDLGVAILSFRSWGRWLLGYPEAAHLDTEHAVEKAREIGQTVSLMYALGHAAFSNIHSGNYATATAQVQEVISLAKADGARALQAAAMMAQGSILALTGQPSNAIQLITSAIATYRSTGATLWVLMHLLHLSRAYAEIGRLDDAWHHIDQAMRTVETTKEKMWEAEIHRIAGELTLMSPERDEPKAEAYFDRALVIAREQQAKSWELRAATSMARLWRDQGKRQQAHDRLAPVYGWFTEGFDTRDLKEAKALLEQLRV
jgi:class 3 adenylate cyclase/predicted ATPase